MATFVLTMASQIKKEGDDIMKCIRVKPMCEPEVINLDGSLEAYQREVGGYIEAIYPFDDEVGLVCNEEGKLNCLPWNRPIKDEDDNVFDVICGTFLIVGLGDGDFADLTDEQINTYTEMYALANGAYLTF